MFLVKRYTNSEGDNLFVPTFNGKPSQPIPSGYSITKEPEEQSTSVLKGQTAENILQGTTAESVLTRSSKKKQEDALKEDTPKVELDATKEVNKQMDSLLQPDKQDEKRMLSTEPPEVVSPESVDRLTSQLKSQYNAIKKSSGYKYKNEKELDYIFNKQATQLASYGINDIRDVGVEEEEQILTIKDVYKKGDKYFYKQLEQEGPDKEVAIDPAKIKDVRETNLVVEAENDSGAVNKKIIEVDVEDTPQRYLINKVTGKRIETREDTGGLTNRGWGNRWGWDNSVQGSADFGVEFVDNNAIFMPVWKDTKTDLTPIMMMASVALMAAGVPAQIGGALTPVNTAAGTQLAVGNAVVAGGMTALSGGSFEDIAKAAVLSGGMSYASAYVPSISKTIGETLLGPGAPGSLTVGTAITNAGINGIAAALMGQDVGKAMLAGSVQGAVQVNASDFLKTAFGEETFKSLSETLNIKPEDMEKVVVRSLSKGAGAMAYNKNFFTTFRDSLISEGLSLSAANTATKAIANNPDLTKDQLSKIHKTIRTVSQVTITAKQRGLNPQTVLESLYPKIILDMAKPVKK